MKITALHLSDIHIADAEDPVLAKAEDIASCMYPHLVDAEHAFIILSGDIAFSGQETQYDLAREFLAKIKEVISKEKNIPINFVICPGNHDCAFRRDNAARRLVIRGLDGSSEIDESIVKTCTEVQSAFFNFRNDLEEGSIKFDDLIFRSSEYTISGKSIIFECLNDSWGTGLHEKPGCLPFSLSRYREMQSDNADLRVILLHHPIHWLSQTVYRDLRAFIRNRSNIVITGHEHRGNVGAVDESESGISIFVEGCSLQQNKSLNNSAFNVIDVDIEQERFKSTQYCYAINQYKENPIGTWESYQTLKIRQHHRFPIVREFKNYLDDSGFPLKHPSGVDVRLGDIYIFPDLRIHSEDENKLKSYIGASELKSINQIDNGVLIQGEEKSGKTSLLHQLYNHYYDNDFVPILLNGSNLKRSASKDIDGYIFDAVACQYGTAKIDEYKQLSRSKKILFVDNFDQLPIKSESARINILSALKDRFDYVILTVGELFELRDFLESKNTDILEKFNRFSLQAFGYKLRSSLIQKWYSIGNEITANESEFIARCDHAERIIDEVMFATLIPSAPLYLITLLHSIEGSRDGEFKDSELGYYYQYLLTAAFGKAGVDADQLTEIFEYTAHLSWQFQKSERIYLSEEELRLFNDEFSKKWHTVNYEQRIDLLVRAKILMKSGEDYCFRYPYVFYYLKGKYLSQFIVTKEVQDYIQHCCEHLYVRDNANTILFLSHHTNDNFVIDCIRDTLAKRFSGKTPLTFEGDTKGIELLIEHAPQIVYSGETPSEYRERRDSFRDEMDGRGDGLATIEEDGDELSLTAQLITLFKTVEILGQVLKSQYSKIQRIRRQQLIKELLQAPLRALKDFYEYCTKNPESLINEIENLLEQRSEMKDKDERKKVARKVAAQVVELMTLGFLIRGVRAISAETLYEDVVAVSEDVNTMAFKLFKLGVRLDSPKNIPKSLLENINKHANGNMIPTRLIRFLILQRLYMFKTSEQDMQWLQEKLEIGIAAQHVITYQNTQQRRLKK
jgi:hypothetical protein